MQSPPGPTRTYHNIIDYIPWAGLHTPVTIPYLPTCTSHSLPLFHPSPHPPSDVFSKINGKLDYHADKGHRNTDIEIFKTFGDSVMKVVVH